MAKRNRRRKTFHLKAASFGIAAMIALIILPWIGYCLLNLSSDQVAAQIRLLEIERRSLDESLRRQVAWNQLTDPKRLDEAVAARGLQMAYAPPSRSARVAANGALNMAPEVAQALQASLARAAGEEMAAQAAGAGVRRGKRYGRL